MDMTHPNAHIDRGAHTSIPEYDAINCNEFRPNNKLT